MILGQPYNGQLFVSSLFVNFLYEDFLSSLEESALHDCSVEALGNAILAYYDSHEHSTDYVNNMILSWYPVIIDNIKRWQDLLSMQHLKY